MDFRRGFFTFQSDLPFFQMPKEFQVIYGVFTYNPFRIGAFTLLDL